MSRTFVILPRAQVDVTEAHDWLFDRSPEGAVAWLNAFDDCLLRVVSAPDSYGYAPEAAALHPELREAYFRTRKGRRYRVLYLFDDKEVVVARVRAPGQDLVSPDDLEV